MKTEVAVHGLVAVIAILCLTYLARLALSLGINGTMLMTVAGIIGLVVGVKADQIKQLAKKWLSVE